LQELLVAGKSLWVLNTLAHEGSGVVVGARPGTNNMYLTFAAKLAIEVPLPPASNGTGGDFVPLREHGHGQGHNHGLGERINVQCSPFFWLALMGFGEELLLRMVLLLAIPSPSCELT
jgi:hypothetical protein